MPVTLYKVCIRILLVMNKLIHVLYRTDKYTARTSHTDGNTACTIFQSKACLD